MAPRVVRMYALPSLEYVAAVLVVLRCSEAFLPLDPSWPEERVQSAGLASNTALLVSSGGLPAYNIAFPVLRLGNIWELSDDNLLSQIHRTRFSLLVFLLFFRLRCSWRLLVPLAGWLHTTLFVMRTLVGDVHFLSTLITPLQTRHVLDLTG